MNRGRTTSELKTIYLTDVILSAPVRREGKSKDLFFFLNYQELNYPNHVGSDAFVRAAERSSAVVFFVLLGDLVVVTCCAITGRVGPYSHSKSYPLTAKGCPILSALIAERVGFRGCVPSVATPKHVGTAALGCPAERSSAVVFFVLFSDLGGSRPARWGWASPLDLPSRIHPAAAARSDRGV